MTARADEVAQQLAEIHWRLQNAWARAASLGDATDWRTPSAAAFHARVAAWRDELAGTVDAADRARDRVLWAQADARATPWGAAW